MAAATTMAAPTTSTADPSPLVAMFKAVGADAAWLCKALLQYPDCLINIVYLFVLLLVLRARQPWIVLGRLIWLALYGNGPVRVWRKHWAKLKAYYETYGHFPEASDYAVGIRQVPIQHSAFLTGEQQQQERHQSEMEQQAKLQQKKQQGPYRMHWWAYVPLSTRTVVEVCLDERTIWAQ